MLESKRSLKLKGRKNSFLQSERQEYIVLKMTVLFHAAFPLLLDFLINFFIVEAIRFGPKKKEIVNVADGICLAV